MRAVKDTREEIGTSWPATEADWCEAWYVEWRMWDPIPSGLMKLTGVEQLRLGYTPITVVPSWIWNLINLKNLWMPDNSFTLLPSEIANLTNLVELDLSWNSPLWALSFDFVISSNLAVQDNITNEWDAMAISWNGTNVVVDIITDPMNWECWSDNGTDQYFNSTKFM